MLTVKGLDHIVLRTENFHAMVNFYIDVLACTGERDLGDVLKMRQLRAGTSLIDIIDVDGELGQAGGSAPNSLGNNMDHFCLAIVLPEGAGEADLLAYLTSKNIEVAEFSQRYGATGFGPSLYIKDPDGNTVELKLTSSID